MTGARRMPAITDDPVRSTDTGGLDRLEPVEQALENNGDLQPGEGRAEAEVVAEPEGEVGVRRPADVEGGRGGTECRLVAIGRGVEQQHRIAGGDVAAAEVGVDGGRAHERGHRRRPAQHLLDRGGNERSVGLQRDATASADSARATMPPEIE